MKKVALYCRVSTDTQEKSATIQNQLSELREIYGSEIVKEYIDNPASGADPDRAGLNQLRKDAQEGLFDIIGIWASDRLARNITLALVLKDEFKEAGVRIEIKGEEREDNDMGKIYSVIEAAIDEIERERIKRRFMAGKNRILSQGKLIGCYPPYGYNHIKRDKEKGIDAKFEINESEAQIIRLIFNLYLQYRSIFLVAKELKKREIKTRGKGDSPKFFQTSTVSKILKRETYIGNYYYGKSSPCIAKYHINKIRKHKLTGRRINPKSEWKLIKVPTIIDQKTFYKIQELMKKKFNSRFRGSKYSPLCQGLIRCVRCGRSYGISAPHNFPLYRCSQSHGLNFNESRCQAHAKSMNNLDEAVWEFVKNLVKNKDKVKDSIRILRERRESDKEKNQKVYNSLTEERKKIRQEKKRIIVLIIKKKYDQDILDEQMSELDDKEEMVNNQIKEVEKEVRDIYSKEETENEIEKICLSYEKKIDEADIELKKFIIRSWVEEINIRDDRAVVLKIAVPGAAMETMPDFSVGFKNIHCTKK